MSETISLPAEGDPGARRSMFAEVTFEELRAYRSALHSEDRRMAYWSWLLHARMEQVSERDTPFRISLLGAATLTPSGGCLRTILLACVATPTLPPIPDLASINDVTDMFELRRIRRGLLAYRRGLQRRRSLATEELIERYRGDPGRCLDFVHASWTRLSLDSPPRDSGRHRASGREDVA